jgi:hypothetical protein
MPKTATCNAPEKTFKAETSLFKNRHSPQHLTTIFIFSRYLLIIKVCHKKSA